MTSRQIILAIVTVALAGCASSTPPLRDTGTISVIEAGALPAPTLVDQSPTARPYVVGPYDELTIDVFGIKEMSDREVQVDAGGNISFPMAGSVRAGGKTPRDIEQELASKLAASGIRNPQVSVNLTKTVSQVIAVDGEVRKPGLYPVVGDLTLMRAVAQAEGTSEFAKLEDVVVFRKSEGRQYVALFNLGAIRRGYYDDPEVYAGDIVIVGESRSRRIFSDILAASPLLTAPIIALLQNN